MQNMAVYETILTLAVYCGESLQTAHSALHSRDVSVESLCKVISISTVSEKILFSSMSNQMALHRVGKNWHLCNTSS